MWNARASNGGSVPLRADIKGTELPPANILIPLERQLIALQLCTRVDPSCTRVHGRVLVYTTVYVYGSRVHDWGCKAVTGLATFSARIVIYLMLIRRAGT